MRRAPELRGREGITLVELLVAVVIFATAMLVGGRFVVGAIHQVGVSETRAQAIEFAIEKIELIRLLPYEQIGAEVPEPVPEAPVYRRSVEVRLVGDSAADLYRYRVATVIVQPPDGLDLVKLSTGVAP